METLPRTSGIYKITCVPTGKLYVGSAGNLYRRWVEHRSTLNRSIHGNRYLQRAWDKYGESAFTFTVIELVFVSFLLEREQLWLDRLKASHKNKGFNLAPIAGSALGTHRTPETKERDRDKAAKDWIVTHPNGTVERVHDLRRFCREQLIDYGAMTALGNGRCDYYRGWLCAREGKACEARSTPMARPTFLAISPEGHEYQTDQLQEFCMGHGLTIANMVAVADGRRKHHKGWACCRLNQGRSLKRQDGRGFVPLADLEPL